LLKTSLLGRSAQLIDCKLQTAKMADRSVNITGRATGTKSKISLTPAVVLTCGPSIQRPPSSGWSVRPSAQRRMCVGLSVQIMVVCLFRVGFNVGFLESGR
jgi:hypothetical protein